MKLKIFLVTLVLASCGIGQNSQSNTVLTVSEFAKKLGELPNPQLIDVRTPEEYGSGHLQNALNFNWNSDEFESQAATLDKTKPVFVYCLSGGRSSSAASSLRSQGFTLVYELNGGIMKWNAANMPLTSQNTSLGTVGMSIDEFNAKVNTEKYVLVDYHAKWCKPCLKMAPMLDTYAENRKDKMTLLKIDADKNQNLLHLKKIESLPVLELYKQGKLIWKHEGEIDETGLEREIKF